MPAHGARRAPRGRFSLLTILAAPGLLGAWEARGGQVDPLEGLRFGPFSKRQLTHPNLEARAAFRYVEACAVAHEQCALRWQAFPEPDSTFGLWRLGDFAHTTVAACAREGGQAFVLRHCGNDTSVFPRTQVLMCLPPECRPGFLREHWLPHVFLIGMERLPRQHELSIGGLRRALRGAQLRVDLAVAFPDPALPQPGLVVAGYPLSGTTSLMAELRRHPQIAAPRHEDQVFWSFVHTQRSTRRWSGWYSKEGARKRAALPGNASLPLIFALKDPFLVFSLEGMRAASRVPGVKVVVVFRDPLEMMQAWINHAATWINPYGDPMGYYVGLQHRHVDRHLSPAGGIPPERLLSVPTLALARAPRLAYRRVMQFLGLPERTRRPFRARMNKLSQSSHAACAAIGRCFDFCKAPGGLLAAAHAMFKMDARKVEALLRRHGWPEDVIDILPPIPRRCPQRRTPPGSPAHWSEADPGLCYAMHLHPSTCFASMDACRPCCEELSTCRLFGPRFAECCIPLERALLGHLRDETRRTLCGSSRAPWPCSKGFGRYFIAQVP